jgi:poly(3-hydroxybutyrate) depolymerase
LDEAQYERRSSAIIAYGGGEILMRKTGLVMMLCLFACAFPCVAQSLIGSPDRGLAWVTDQVTAPRVVYRTFDSRAAAGKVSYHVYTPATYDDPNVRLPVLYWLHGTDGGLVGIRPMSQYFDEAIAAGKMPAMIVVFVNGLPRRLWADSKDGSSPVETVFIADVISDVDKEFRTIAKREGRILEGFSMGGYGAARLGFRHPELFAGISILAGGPLDLEFRGPRAQQNPRLREQILRDMCGNDMDYFRAISPWSAAATAAVALRDKKTVIR